MTGFNEQFDDTMDMVKSLARGDEGTEAVLSIIFVHFNLSQRAALIDLRAMLGEIEPEERERLHEEAFRDFTTAIRLLWPVQTQHITDAVFLKLRTLSRAE